jgi:hypothetical protein
MLLRDLSHSRCVHRCCCRSWSCEPHLADCEIATGHHRRGRVAGLVVEGPVELVARRPRSRRRVA